MRPSMAGGRGLAAWRGLMVEEAQSSSYQPLSAIHSPNFFGANLLVESFSRIPANIPGD